MFYLLFLYILFIIKSFLGFFGKCLFFKYKYRYYSIVLNGLLCGYDRVKYNCNFYKVEILFFLFKIVVFVVYFLRIRDWIL